MVRYMYNLVKVLVLMTSTKENRKAFNQKVSNVADSDTQVVLLRMSSRELVGVSKDQQSSSVILELTLPGAQTAEHTLLGKSVINRLVN